MSELNVMSGPFVSLKAVGVFNVAKRAAHPVISFTTRRFFELRACVNYYSGCLPHLAGQQGVWVRMGGGWLFIVWTHAVSLFFLVKKGFANGCEFFATVRTV